MGDDWQSTDTAPHDGRKIEGEYEEGIDLIYWSDQRYCMLGAPQGSKGPGWISDEISLPVDPPLRWRARTEGAQS